MKPRIKYLAIALLLVTANVGVIYLFCNIYDKQDQINLLDQRVDEIELLRKQEACSHSTTKTESYKRDGSSKVGTWYRKRCGDCNKVLLRYGSEREYLEARLEEISKNHSLWTGSKDLFLYVDSSGMDSSAVIFNLRVEAK